MKYASGGHISPPTSTTDSLYAMLLPGEVFETRDGQIFHYINGKLVGVEDE